MKYYCDRCKDFGVLDPDYSGAGHPCICKGTRGIIYNTLEKALEVKGAIGEREVAIELISEMLSMDTSQAWDISPTLLVKRTCDSVLKRFHII